MDRNRILDVLSDLETNLYWLNLSIFNETTLSNKINYVSTACKFTKIVFILMLLVTPISSISYILKRSMEISKLVFGDSSDAHTTIILIVLLVVFIPTMIIIVSLVCKKISHRLDKRYNEAVKKKNYYQELCNNIAIQYEIPSELCYYDGVKYVNQLMHSNQNITLTKAIVSYRSYVERKTATETYDSEQNYQSYVKHTVEKESKENADRIVSELRRSNELHQVENDRLYWNQH